MHTILTVQTIDSPLESLDKIGQYAANRESHLIVIVVGIAAALPVMTYAEVPAYDWGREFNEKYQVALSRAEEIKERLGSKGISVTVIAACQELSSLAELISRNVLYADYFLLPPASILTARVHTRCLDGAIFEAAAPVLAMPDDIAELPKITTVLAAWHPSPHTASAFRAVIPLLAKDTQLHIVAVDPKEHLYGANPGDDIATYLARKGLNITIDVVAGNDQSITDVIRQKAMDINADMIVMGAYGHSRMREWFLGSTTTQILANIPKPLFLHH